jgi:hypothetical protein
LHSSALTAVGSIENSPGLYLWSQTKTKQKKCS